MKWLSSCPCCCAIAVVLALLSTPACARDARADRVNDDWRTVQSVFDRVEKFETEFRVAAAAEAGKPDSEKLQFARDVLSKKLQLQFDLQEEIRRTTTTLASRPASVRACHQAYFASSMTS